MCVWASLWAQPGSLQGREGLETGMHSSQVGQGPLGVGGDPASPRLCPSSDL